jgi:predicted nucleic acid-binding Zn ribbon protein
VKGREEQPSTLSELLDTLAGRLRRVDLRLIDEARARWTTSVDPVLAEHCRVELIKDRVLIVSVPSGAFAQRVQQQSPTILRSFSTLSSGAPTSIKTVLREAKKPSESGR